MSNFDSILLELGLSQPLEQKNGSNWITAESLDVRKMAGLMLASGARFITINGIELSESSEIRLDYHWDLNGELVSVITHTSNSKIAAITDICPAADWIERELHEHMAVDFEGAEPTKPLFLKHGEEPGTMLRKARAL
jgi:NADH:ubiquinone oxidoreductase subunit C